MAEKISHVSPDTEIKHIYKNTLGDSDLDTPLNKMPDIGVFTNDIRDDLIEGRADIAVHSWKDLPVKLEKGTEIIGTIERADMRDMVFLKKESLNKEKIIILSSSPRRERNLSGFLPYALPFKADISFKDVRGNILTRLKKLIEGNEDGLVVAKAAIDRLMQARDEEFKDQKKALLEMQNHLKWMVIPLSQNPSAAAQGALAIEARVNDKEVKDIIDKISDLQDFSSVEIERNRLKSYGGGCHQKIGVSHEILETGKLFTIKGETEEGEEISERIFTEEERKESFNLLNTKNYFPFDKQEQKFFEREELEDSSKNLKSIRDKGIYVSRSNSIKESALIDDSNIIWTSGLDTWKSLAKKGYWVNGTSDSLGEFNSPEQSPFRDIQWLKISHKHNLNDKKEILATYELIPLEPPNRIMECDYFYWMSASSFQLALKVYPEIKKRNHACGLGKTFDLIKKEVPLVSPFLSFDDWLDTIKNKLK